jgi:hypothetical protein
MKRVHHGHRLGIQRRQFGFVGERVRPIGALIDPLFDRVDLFGAKRPVGGICMPKAVPEMR